MHLARLVLLLLLAFAPAQAETIAVGPERAIKLPSLALRSASEGDTIAIDEGEYYDCLRVNIAGLTIEGGGAGAVLTDTTCDGKAIIVAAADRLTLRNLTLQRARVPDGNGAGIRAEGRGLTVEKLRFINNQAGLLGADNPASIIIIRDSRFEGNGQCDGARCVPAIVVGVATKLRIERSQITGTRDAHQIVSSARSTEIVGSLIEDGARGSASLQLFLPAGGSLLLEENVFQKGPRSGNLRAAVLIDGGAGAVFAARRNRFINQTGQSVPFILNWSDGSPVLQGNAVEPVGDEVSTSGYLTHRAAGLARGAKQAARDVTGIAKRGVQSLLRW